jgi:16S rRNA (uracil1498-N3)-methyltransferase
MRHRIYAPELPASGELTVSGEEFHHAARVARVHEGEEVELFDGRGGAASAVVASVGLDSVVVRVGSPIESREAKLAIDVAMSIIQLEKFELVLQKVTELGARSIIPLVTDRAEVRPERYRGKAGRWEKIVFEAVKQSGRSVVPKVALPVRFDDAVSGSGIRIIYDADAEPSSIDLAAAKSVTLFIGPEGGWSERELGIAREHGCLFARLGRRRLRAETAAIVATATMAARSGELD